MSFVTKTLKLVKSNAWIVAVIVALGAAWWIERCNRREGYGNAVTYNCMTNMGSSVGNVVTDQGIAAATQLCQNAASKNTNSRNAAKGTYARVAPPPWHPSWHPPCALCWLYPGPCSAYGCK